MDLQLRSHFLRDRMEYRNPRRRRHSSGSSDERYELMGMASDQLREAWEDRDLAYFKKILKNLRVHDQPTGGLGDLLEEIINAPSEQDDLKEYAKALLENYEDVDSQDDTKSGAIHYAADKANLPVLEALLEANANPNLTNIKGETALHIAATENTPESRECLRLLLSRSNIDINVIDAFGKTPIQRAMYLNNREAVELLRKKEAEIRWSLPFRGGNIRWRHMPLQESSEQMPLQESSEQSPSTERIMMPPSKEPRDASRMMLFLEKYQQEEFCKDFRENHHQFEKEKDELLLTACANNLEEAVRVLLAHGANPSGSVCLAIEKGYPEILKTLLTSMEFKTEKMTPHTAPLLLVAAQNAYCSTEHMECFQIVLDKMKEEREWIDVNEKDSWGKTALFYALRRGNESVVADILQLGACMTTPENMHGGTSLSYIPHHMLQQTLGQNLIHTSANKFQETLEMNYSFLKPPINKNVKKDNEDVPVPETKLLLQMSNEPHLRPLLTHPLLRIYIMYKWRQLRRIFLLNLFFYSVLCIYLTIYILWMAVPWGTNDDSSQVSTLTTSRIILGCLFITLTLRELFQAILSYETYFMELENYLEILLICFGGYITIQDCTRSFTPEANSLCPPFGAAAIVIAWLELLLLLGRHPLFAVQVEMFSRVFLSFLKFLSVYLIMILAFALSFFVLFQNCAGVTGCDNSFNGTATAIFKTLAMVSGEFEWGNIPFSKYFYTSHIIFTIFVFLIAIVLLNLLNGLAVQDVKKIHDDALLELSVARIKYICSLEEILQAVRKWSSCWSHVFPNFRNFPEKIVINFDGTMREFNYKEYGVGYSGKQKLTTCRHRFTGCNLYCEIVQVAREPLKAKADQPAYVQDLLEESEKQTKSVDEIKKTNLENFDATSKRVEALLTAMEQSREKSEAILEAVERKEKDVVDKISQTSREVSEGIIRQVGFMLMQSRTRQEELTCELEETTKKMLEETTKKMLEETTKKMLEETTKKILEETTKKMLEETTKKMLEETTKKMLEAMEESRRQTQLMNEKLLEDIKKQLGTMEKGPGPSRSS